MANKPTKPARPGDMRFKVSRKQYGTVDNRDKVIPREQPYPESMNQIQKGTTDGKS